MTTSTSPGGDFAAVKAAYPLSRYIAQRGLKAVNETGTGFYVNPAPCCGHNDCFHVTPEKELWNCFSCSAGGDIFALAEIVDSGSKSELLHSLAQEIGVKITPPATSSSGSSKKTGVEGLWSAAVEHFHAALLANREMLDYQLGAGKYGKIGRHHKIETLKKFRIGWADGRLQSAMADKSFHRATLIKSSLFREPENENGDGLREFFNGCFVYPSFDSGANVLHFRCKFPKPLEGGKARAGYQLPAEARNKDWVCYNQGALGRHDEIVVCEGEDDLLTWVESGIPNVIATCGQPGKALLDFLVKHHGGKTFYTAFDQDAAGARFTETFHKRGLRVKVVGL